MANDFYQHSGHPGTRAPRSSALLRAEFAAIEDGFDKLPDVGTPNLFSVSDGSALVGKTVAQAKVLLALENVTNTADADKPISTLTQAALAGQAQAINLKAPLASPALTGTPTAPTADAEDSSTAVATTAFVASGLALKADLASPALTGAPTAPNAPATVYDQRVANMATAEAMVRHLMETYYFEGAGTTNGWRRFRNNLCLQWGTTLAPAEAGLEHGTLFPVSFTAEPYAVLCTGRTDTSTANSVWVTDAFATHFNARASLASQSYHWWAIGPLG